MPSQENASRRASSESSPGRIEAALPRSYAGDMGQTSPASVVGQTLVRAAAGIGLGLGIAIAATVASRAAAGEPRTTERSAGSLRLVPFPKQVSLADGAFDLSQPLTLQRSAAVTEVETAPLIAELRRVGLPVSKQTQLAHGGWMLRLAHDAGGAVAKPTFRDGAGQADYELHIERDAITCCGPAATGLFYAVQTLCQLIRANCDGTRLPCLAIADWPSLGWRCAQDDLTRGPSSTLATLCRGIELGASLKLNLFTYYMEYQYAFAKHPTIGPRDGSLTPDELRSLVSFARTQHTEILGNQQSFGHFERILSQPQYAELGENPSVLSPVHEGTYALLDDLYSEVCPLLPFEMFNVCCDETWGLGEGPSKELASRIGTGGVYVQHIRRVHELLRSKYGKRMMMWGDIILRHPDKLDQIPRDTVMLTWGYDPRDSFENQILPFKDAGYEFLVCPGISNWSRILPDFGVAMTNIRNFVRDGARHGALGMVNTDWEDDGEALQGYRWHGHAWGAECAWNASMTSPADFNRRIGAVLFGEPDDHFGQAIELLAQTHRLPRMQGMSNRRFWERDFAPTRSPAAIRQSAERLLQLTRPAIAHLETCRRQATINADLLDAFLHGARRMELIATRMTEGLEAAELYTRAAEQTPRDAIATLEQVQTLVRRNRDAHEASGREFQRLWLADCKPYALDWTMDRYAATVQSYDEILKQLAKARHDLQQGRALPPAATLGIALPERFTRRNRPHQTQTEPLDPEAPWADPEATARIGLIVKAGKTPRAELPLELDVALPARLAVGPVRAFCAGQDGGRSEILAQLDPLDAPDKTRLTLIIPDPIHAGREAKIYVYLGRGNPPPALPGQVRTGDVDREMRWIENDRIRWILGAEGAHIYQWRIKALDGRDLTQPGDTGWAGFADVGGAGRNASNTLVCTRRGPALVQYRCTDPTGLEKTINFFGGVAWIEVLLNEPQTYYWEFDNPINFAADGPTPGEYLFSTGQTGRVGRLADGVSAQVKASSAQWAIKFCRDGLALGMVSPDQPGAFCVAPGGGAGGVGIERSPPLGRFITFGDRLAGDPRERMESLRRTLAFADQPTVVVHRLQQR